jgi:hypothetical protein
MQTPQRFPLKLITLFTIGLVLALGALLLTPSPAPAQPTISWTPESLTKTVLARESVTVPVSFTASEKLTNVIARVVPEIAPYVSTNPTLFASIAKGQTINLDVIVSAPADTLPKVVEGTIQLRSGQGPPKTFAKPLPVTVHIRLSPTTPESVLRQLAFDLQTSNIDAALQRFISTSSNHDTLAGLNSDQRARFATALSNARLLESTDDLSIYSIPWIEEDGSTIDLEITLTKTDQGEWVIISW